MQEQLPRTFAQERTGMYSQRVSGAIPNCRRIHREFHGLILRFNSNNPNTCAKKHQGAGTLLQGHAVNPSMGGSCANILFAKVPEQGYPPPAARVCRVKW